MKWLLILILIFLLPIPVKSAICDPILITPNEKCQLLTPYTGATTYQLFNVTDLVDSGSLTVFNNSVMYFNISQPVGFYIAQLEDNLTRELEIGYSEESMGASWIAIIVALAFMTIIYTAFAITLKDKNLKGLKAFLFLLSLANAFIIGISSYVIALNPTDSSAYEPVAIGIFGANGLAFVGIVWFYAVYLVKRGVLSGKND